MTCPRSGKSSISTICRLGASNAGLPITAPAAACLSERRHLGLSAVGANIFEAEIVDGEDN